MTRLLTPRFFRSATLVLGLFATCALSAPGPRARSRPARRCATPSSPTACSRPSTRARARRSSTSPTPTDPTKDSKNVDRLDLGPQIAVWLESADRSVFVDTLMVTNQVARARHRQSPRPLELRLQPEVPLRQAADGVAHLGPFARQALSDGGVPGRRHRRPPRRLQRRGAHRLSRALLVARAVLLPAADAVGVRRRDHLSLGAVQQLEGALRHDAAPVLLPAAQRPRQQSA